MSQGEVGKKNAVVDLCIISKGLEQLTTQEKLGTNGNFVKKEEWVYLRSKDRIKLSWKTGKVQLDIKEVTDYKEHLFCKFRSM